jgi:ATP adenylyltransferase/5',5'''-P-1,P-4-tetraphosphate phosphorylase II
MDKKEKMTASLEKNLPTIEKDRPGKIDKDIKDDYDFSRKTYKDLIYNGTRSMDVLSELAIESEHPRAFEVLAQTIKNISDVTKNLMDLQKQKKDLTKEEREEAKTVTNNNMFVGSTTDLQRMLLNKDNVIDATDNKE